MSSLRSLADSGHTMAPVRKKLRIRRKCFGSLSTKYSDDGGGRMESHKSYGDSEIEVRQDAHYLFLALAVVKGRGAKACSADTFAACRWKCRKFLHLNKEDDLSNRQRPNS